MKIAVSSTGKGLDSPISPVFGRCAYFVVVETEGKEIKGSKDVPNTAAGQTGGAGITAAQLVGNEGVDAVITSNMGPRAFGVMEQLGIKVFHASEGTVREVVQQHLEGKLKQISSATGPMGGVFQS